MLARNGRPLGPGPATLRDHGTRGGVKQAAEAEGGPGRRSWLLVWLSLAWSRLVRWVLLSADFIEQVADGLDDGVRVVGGDRAVPGVFEDTVLATGDRAGQRRACCCLPDDRLILRRAIS